MGFKDFLKESELNEAKVTVGSVSKFISKLDLGILLPQAFEVEKWNNDAGMGGEELIRVWLPRKIRDKDVADVELVKSSIQSSFKDVRMAKDGDKETAIIIPQK